MLQLFSASTSSKPWVRRFAFCFFEGKVGEKLGAVFGAIGGGFFFLGGVKKLTFKEVDWWMFWAYVCFLLEVDHLISIIYIR